MSNSDFLNAEKLLKSEQYEKALTLYNNAVSAEKFNPIYVSQRAVCYFHLKQLPNALKDMDKAVELDPEYSYRYASRAFIRDASGDTKGAVEDYKRAIELDPSDAVAFNNLGLLEEKLGYLEASQKNFKKADELAKLLEETGVVTESELKESAAPKPENIQKNIDKENSKNSTVSAELKKVFTKKETFKEFLSFVKNGFKR